MPRKGYDFEYWTKRGLENFLVEFGIKGRVRREYQRLPNYLGTDITVDTLDHRYYIAVECKSVNLTLKKSKKSLSGLFHYKKDGTYQLDVITDYLNDTGRVGYLAVELRPPKHAFLIPWRPLLMMQKKKKSLPMDWLVSFPEVKRQPKGYHFTPEVFL